MMFLHTSGGSVELDAGSIAPAGERGSDSYSGHDIAQVRAVASLAESQPIREGYFALA